MTFDNEAQSHYTYAMTEQIGLDRLTGLIAFARTASLGSYTAAARALSISPSAVSKSVQRLEARLGVRLFARTTRSLALTPEGRELHERALKLLRDAAEIEQVAVSARGEPSGILRIAAPVPLAVHLIAPGLARFREKYPQLTVDLRVSDRISNLVEEGIDVAVRVGDPKDSSLIARQLARNSAGIFASPDYLGKRGTPKTIEDIEAHDCVNVRVQNTGQPLSWPLRVGTRQIEILPKAAILVDNTEAVAAAICGGGGIGLLPTYVAAPCVARGELVPILHQFWAQRHAITALWSDNRRKSPNVKAFVEYLVELFPNPTPWDKALFDRATQTGGFSAEPKDCPKVLSR